MSCNQYFPKSGRQQKLFAIKPVADTKIDSHFPSTRRNFLEPANFATGLQYQASYSINRYISNPHSLALFQGIVYQNLFGFTDAYLQIFPKFEVEILRCILLTMKILRFHVIWVLGFSQRFSWCWLTLHHKQYQLLTVISSKIIKRKFDAIIFSTNHMKHINL